VIDLIGAQKAVGQFAMGLSLGQPCSPASADCTTDPGQSLPTVSVLVAAWNEAARIDACLDSLEAIGWPGLDILVSAGGDDDSYEVASRHASERVTVLRQHPNQGKQAALRELFTCATGDVVYLTDADSIVPEETLRSVLAPIVRGEAEVVTGTYRPHVIDATNPLVFYQWSIDRAVERRRGSESDGITGANAAVTRRALLATGAFTADAKTGTDYVLARQLRLAGYRIRYVDAGVETEYADRPRHYARRRARWLRNTVLHGWRSGDHAEVRHSLVTMGLGVATLAGLFAFPLRRRGAGFAWAGLMALLIKRRVDYAVALGRETNPPPRAAFFLLLPCLILLDQVSSVLALVDLISWKRRTRW
jgi:cellulose synthase/poly-beta-1,6-N-acetylglucosamine synthase-like glycosyltransferase